MCGRIVNMTEEEKILWKNDEQLFNYAEVYRKICSKCRMPGCKEPPYYCSVHCYKHFIESGSKGLNRWKNISLKSL